MAESLKCDPDPDATLACLRGVPLDTLLPAVLALAETIGPPYGTSVIHPVIDGDFIPDQPVKLVLEGSFVKGGVI